MTTVTMTWPQMKLKVEGHANTAPKGQDIVCAAESMLVCALAGTLEEAQQRGRLKMEYKESDGKVEITADPQMGSLAEAKAYFRMAVKGFRMLREEYPSNVCIREVM